MIAENGDFRFDSMLVGRMSSGRRTRFAIYNILAFIINNILAFIINRRYQSDYMLLLFGAYCLRQ